MDYAKILNDLRTRKGQLLKDADALLEAGKFDEVTARQDEAEKLANQIAAVEKQAALSADNAEVSDSHTEAVKDEVRPFRSLGEQLQAIRNIARSHKPDGRLERINNSALGGNETTGADGGYALQEDFAGNILDTVVENSELLRRVDSYSVSAGSNSARWLQLNETDVSSSVFGGIQTYWAAEAAQVNASKPAFRELKLDLEKIMGFAYATDELLEDAPFMSGLYERGFALAVDRLLTEAVISGDGVGKPLGILNSDALITVAKESGQTAGSLLGANVVKMWNRLLTGQRKNAVWVMHPDLEAELPGLSITSRGSAEKFLWDPEGGLAGLDYQRVLGRPVIFDDACSTIGSKGDVLLIDPSQYILLRKGAAKTGWSIHVQWLTDQSCFRIVLRVNGAPKVNSAVTLNHSSSTRSPFITLAARA